LRFIKRKLASSAPKKYKADQLQIHSNIQTFFNRFRWRKVGEVVEVFCYPIKSCGWIKLDEIDCMVLGAQSNNIRDRIFMVVNSSGEFVTGRKYPTLVQIMPTIEGDVMTMSAPGKDDVELSFKELSKKKPSNAIVWNESVEIIDCGDEVAGWLSDFILSEDKGLRLVYYPASLPSRDVREKNKIFDTTFRKDVGALHDATSFMLINQKSVDELNSRVDNAVTALQFRPNFVVKGPEAFDEDNWKFVRIGDEVVFQNVKPCTRFVASLTLRSISD
jgi:uncharacterized protein YcbX